MNQVILVRFNEIHLKGGNKKYFIKLLYKNIKDALKDFDVPKEILDKIIKLEEDEEA